MSDNSLGDSATRSSVLGDIDGDGDLDRVMHASGQIWLNDGIGDFVDADRVTARNAELADFDGDGDLDALSRNGGGGLWLNDRSGVFFRTGIAPRAAHLPGDYDGDGDLDAIGSGSVLWPNELIAPSADFDNSGDVSGHDFLDWQRGFGLPNPTAAKSDGDADNDFDVDLHDLDVWQTRISVGRRSSELISRMPISAGRVSWTPA